MERQPSGQRQSPCPTANGIDGPLKKRRVKNGEGMQPAARILAAYSLRPPFLLRRAACHFCHPAHIHQVSRLGTVAGLLFCVYGLAVVGPVHRDVDGLALEVELFRKVPFAALLV